MFSDYIVESGTLDWNISDHEPTYLLSRSQTLGRSYVNYNYEEFKQALLAANWNEYYQIQNPNLAWDFILDVITLEMDRQCPKKPIKIRIHEDPWITNEMREL